MVKSERAESNCLHIANYYCSTNELLSVSARISIGRCCDSFISVKNPAYRNKGGMDRQGIEPCSTAVMLPYITIHRPLYVCKGCAERIMLYSMAASKLLRFLCKHPFKNSLQTYCTDAPNQLHANICTPHHVNGFRSFSLRMHPQGENWHCRNRTDNLYVCFHNVFPLHQCHTNTFQREVYMMGLVPKLG